MTDSSLPDDDTDTDVDSDNPTAREVHDRVRSMILGGEFDDLGAFSQVKLSKKLGVSRTPLREALRMLEREGLVEQTPNKRAKVTPISAQDLDELYGLRIMLEGLSIFVSTAKASAADIEDARRSLVHMSKCEAAQDRVGWEIPHESFHSNLTCHAGTRLLVSTRELRDHSHRYVSRFIEEPLAWMAGRTEHQAIFEAFAARDSALAAERLGLHLARTALTLIARMAPAHDAVATRGALHFVQLAQLGR